MLVEVQGKAFVCVLSVMQLPSPEQCIILSMDPVVYRKYITVPLGGFVL